MKRRFNHTIFFWLLLPTALLRAENWPGFRGPTHQGISAENNLPLHWNDTSNVLWKAQIPGEGWSSPIVWGNRAFLTTTTENGQSCRVLSLDVLSGRILWNKVVFQQIPRHKQERNSFATPTPAADDAR